MVCVFKKKNANYAIHVWNMIISIDIILKAAILIWVELAVRQKNISISNVPFNSKLIS